MSTCVAGICAPIGSPVAQPLADSPPPSSDTSVPPIVSQPPPAESPPPPSTTSSPATPSSSQTSPPPPPVQQSTSKSSAKSPPSPVLEWSSASSSSKSSDSNSSSVSVAVIAGVATAGVALLMILGILLICCARKKRKDQIGPKGKGYYMAPPPLKDGSNNGHMQQYYQQSNPPSSEFRVSNLPPPPGSGYRPSQVPSSNSNMPPDFYMSGNSGPAYKSSDNPNIPLSRGVTLSSQCCFSYEELAKATNGFSKSNFLGQGGFGFVHKGTLKDGKEVAIKSLKADSGQGEREFQAEIDVISRVHHKHLVTLVGYCITGTQRMLVYEFVANKTLEFHLYGKGRPTMDWPTRLKIALGAAKGLAYLHEDCYPKIIHRDIKGANILLDFQFESKVADFGLAKFTEDTNTHVSTRIMGTFGYLAPEYASSGKLTEKSDVFSFGVMLLELITGRRPVDRTSSMDDSLVDWAEPLLAKAMEDGNFEPLVDPKLQNNYNRDEMARMVACAAGATSHSSKRRPKMSQIVRALDSSLSLSDLNNGMAPGETRGIGGNGSPEYTTGQYKEDMKRFRKMMLQNQDNASAGYTTGTTSDYSVAYSESSTGSQV